VYVTPYRNPGSQVRLAVDRNLSLRENAETKRRVSAPTARGQVVRGCRLRNIFCFGLLTLLLHNAVVATARPAEFQAAPPASSVKSLAITRDNRTILNNLGAFKNLEVLSITCLESLKALPDSIDHLTKLRELTIDNANGCSMNPLLPKNFGNLHLLEKLVLYGAQDPGMPDQQPAERHKFPQSMSQLKNLIFLDLGRNGFKQVPIFVGDLPKLRELRFEWNKLTKLPYLISGMHELKILRLKGNNLDDLPNFLNNLPNLNLITLGNNCKITQNPLKMKQLKERFPKITFDFMDEYDCPTK
jgi:hypothetical protein